MEMTRLCRCCLLRPPDKDLRTPYVRLETGIPEVYMDVLEKCFEIHVILGNDGECGICSVCVGRLLDANNFKLQVQRCQVELQARLAVLLVEDEESPIQSEGEEDRTNVDFTSHEEPAVQSEASGDAASDGGGVSQSRHQQVSENSFNNSQHSSGGRLNYSIQEKNRIASFHPESIQSSSDGEETTEDLNHETPTSSKVAVKYNRKAKNTSPDSDEEDNTSDSSGVTKTHGNHQVPTTSTTTEKWKRTKDFCFFCETSVLNFARHVIRNHTIEPEVQKILSYPTKSYTRKITLTDLRKRGNYIANVSRCVKPMKKSNLCQDVDYMPCEKCLGFYSRKQLCKHRKTCEPLSKTFNSQVDAQNFILRNMTVDKKLKEEVFPKMRPDRVSLEAKRDSLICAFGARYLRIHREKHFVNVTSRKMRELAKLLIELKKLKPTLKDFMDCLKPQNYDVIVTATKNVSGYDDKLDRYGAPTYAMNISTSIKQCCYIAITNILKSGSCVQTAPNEADVKTLILLIESNWKFDVVT